MEDRVPGFNYGYSGSLVQNNPSNAQALSVYSNSFSQSVTSGITSNCLKVGVSDDNCIRAYVQSAGGWEKPSEEGTVGIAINMNDRGEYYGQSLGASDTMHRNLQLVQGPDTQIGVGRPMIDLTTVVSGSVATSTPSTLFPGLSVLTLTSGSAALPVSTCGDLPAAILTPPGAETNEPSLMTFTVNTTTALTEGEGITMVGTSNSPPYLESSVVTNPQPFSAGQQVISVPLRYNYGIGSKYCAGALSGGAFVEHSEISSAFGTRRVFQIIGAPTSSTFLAAVMTPQGFFGDGYTGPFNLYRGAIVTSTINPSTNLQDGKGVKLSPNNVAWTSGDDVEETEGLSETKVGMRSVVDGRNPWSQTLGMDVQYSTATFGGGWLYHATNGINPLTYTMGGGSANPPYLIGSENLTAGEYFGVWPQPAASSSGAVIEVRDVASTETRNLLPLFVFGGLELDVDRARNGLKNRTDFQTDTLTYRLLDATSAVHPPYTFTCEGNYGGWVFSQDGYATFCDQTINRWVPKGDGEAVSGDVSGTFPTINVETSHGKAICTADGSNCPGGSGSITPATAGAIAGYLSAGTTIAPSGLTWISSQLAVPGRVVFSDPAFAGFVDMEYNGSSQLIAHSTGTDIFSISTIRAAFNERVVAPIFHETLTTPASSSDACYAGDFTDDADYHYVCVASNTWKRVALSSF